MLAPIFKVAQCASKIFGRVYFAAALRTSSIDILSLDQCAIFFHIKKQTLLYDMRMSEGKPYQSLNLEETTVFFSRKKALKDA